MQLRSFEAYTNTAPVIPTLIGGWGLTTNKPCSLVNLDGYALGVGYLQIFDLSATAQLVSGVTVPLKSFQVMAAGPLPSLFGELGPILLSAGLCVAFSSTGPVYTAVATSYSVFGEIAEFENRLEGDNTTTTTANDTLVVWSQATGPKHLMRLDIVNAAAPATKRWLVIFADDATVKKPALIMPLFYIGAAGITVIIARPSFVFGDNGLVPFAEGIDGTGYQGCTALITGSLTLPIIASADGSAMTAWYKS